MKKVLIFGAGSIGNHMSYACSKLGYGVYVTDIDPNALLKMKNKIFPKRYKKWKKNIKLTLTKDLFSTKEKFDLIIIGTPPGSHLYLYNFCKKNLKFDKLLIEKPLCVHTQNFNNINFDYDKNFCGYNHSISQSFLYLQKLIKKEKPSKISSIEIDWKEGWFGILNAHFWMKSEFDSYLGNLKDGGGALHEHSHGLHLLTVILKDLNIDINKISFNKEIIFKKKKSKKYDCYDSFIAYHKNTIIKYETDLLTYPSKKEIRINYKNKCIIWKCNFKINTDSVEVIDKKSTFFKLFKKTRSSEFENEIKYILSNKNLKNSNLNINYSVKTMKCIRTFLKK